MTESEGLRIRSAAITDAGRVRRVNEDACLERPLPEGGIWVVADGMGGHHAGDVAARMVAEALQDVASPANLSELIDGVEDRLQDVHRRLGELAGHGPDARTIGATVAALLCYRRQAVCMWAGDSRIYLLRDGGLRRLTRDHSEVEELICEGRLRRDEAESHPAANVITRAVGGILDEDLELEVRYQELRAGDRFLLCSDGLYKELGNDEIAALLSAGDVGRVARSLLDEALERAGRDNITVIVVELEPD